MANHLLDDLKEDWVANQIISPNGEPFGQEKFGWNYIMKKINSMIRMLNSHADSIENQVRFEFVSAVPDPADAEFNVIYLVPNGSPTISGSSYDEYCLVQNGSTRSMEKFGPAKITKSEVGLGNVNNTSDADKPVSTAQQEALDTKVDKTTTINDKTLDNDITLTPSDIGAAPSSHNHDAGDITSGTLPAARGGTGQTTLNAAAKSLINSLPTATGVPVDATYYVSQNNDGSDTYYRRPVSALYNYIKSKTDAVYLKLSGGTMTGKIATSSHTLGSSSVTNSIIELHGGTSYQTGAYLTLIGGTNTSRTAGSFELNASTGTPVRLIGTTSGSLTWGGKNIVRSVDGINSDSSGNVQTITPNRLYPFKWTVDLSGLNENTYYPVVNITDVAGPWGPDTMKRRPPIRLVLNVTISEGGIPSWATNPSGFCCRIQCDFQGSGWGMANRPYLVVHQQNYGASNKSPAFIRQLTNSTMVCFYLRGGGKYPIYSNWNFESWQICTTSTTFREQTVAPITNENILGSSMVGEKPLYNLYSSPGAIIWHAKSCPYGYLLCNGAAVSRTNYAELFAVIGTTYGSGDGSTTFNLPNLIDKFIQGSGTAGTVKAAGLPNITGSMNYGPGGGPTSAGGAFASSGNITHWSDGDSWTGINISFSASRSSSIYGNSTTVQPPAVTMLPCIKY